VTQSSHARIVAEPGRVRVISVVDEARLEPQVVGEYIDWRAATETELSIGFARGDEACLQEVFRRLAPLIYTIAYRALDSSTDGEEITQEVFVSAWRARGGPCE
jgi:Sigma-70 region 2